MHYNPFAYIRSEKDILKLVNTIIVNTKGDGDKSGEDFWVKAEKLYYTALIGYIWYEAPEHEKNFTTLLEMINASEAREDDESFKNPVDIMFDELEAREPDHFAVKQYKKYKLAAGKTAKSILISCGARLAPFDIAELRELMSYDEMELDTLGDRKTALFVIISDTDDMEDYQKKAEQNMVDLQDKKAKAQKSLLRVNLIWVIIAALLTPAHLAINYYFPDNHGTGIGELVLLIGLVMFAFYFFRNAYRLNSASHHIL